MGTRGLNGIYNSVMRLSDIKRTAQLSRNKRYRYTLTRKWSEGPCIAFLMFNPSTADAKIDDHTIRKCMGFAQRWGYGSMVVLNLFAFRSTNPGAVCLAHDAVGPDNDWHILTTLKSCTEVVCAWGCSSHIRGRLAARVPEVVNMLAGLAADITCLGTSKDGSPRHPLMLSYDTKREPLNMLHWG